MEDLELTDPVTPPPQTVTSYKVRSLHLDWEKPGVELGTIGVVAIQLEDNLGGPFAYQYEGDQAISLMKWMNTADFSTTSMHKRILQKLTNDGVLPPGTVTGAPDPPAGEL